MTSLTTRSAPSTARSRSVLHSGALSPLRPPLLTPAAEPHPLRRRGLGKVHHRQRQAGPRPPEPVGRYQRRGREPLRIRLPPQLLAPHPPPGPHRDDVADPLRDVPRQAAAGAEGEQCPGPRQQAHQPVGGARDEPQLATDDHERLLRRGRGIAERARESEIALVERSCLLLSSWPAVAPPC